MGVDEDVTHLADDIDKLLNSEIPHAYIVHFLRESYLDQVCDSLVVRPGGNVHVTYVTYVRLLRGEVFYKLLGTMKSNPDVSIRTSVAYAASFLWSCVWLAEFVAETKHGVRIVDFIFSPRAAA